ncbi:MAG: hypothetical protein GQ557_00290 [Mycoplasmataceae bacterium]|nr:hypothetical protein [Mycoplasmataceae bacterium]
MDWFFLITIIILGTITFLLALLWTIMWVLQFIYKKNHPNWAEEAEEHKRLKEQND